MLKKSRGAAGVCAWCINMLVYYDARNGSYESVEMGLGNAEVLSSHCQDALAGEQQYDGDLIPDAAVDDNSGEAAVEHGGAQDQATGIDKCASASSLDDGRLHLSLAQVKKKVQILHAFQKRKWIRETKHLTSYGVQVSSLHTTEPIMTFASCPTGRIPKKVILPRTGGRGGIAVAKAAAVAEAEALSASVP